jgi:iron transport multicopper oxidase
MEEHRARLTSYRQTVQIAIPAGNAGAITAGAPVRLYVCSRIMKGADSHLQHPFHLHGVSTRSRVTRVGTHHEQQSFSVVRGAGQSGYNFVNPPRRDVVNTG